MPRYTVYLQNGDALPSFKADNSAEIMEDMVSFFDNGDVVAFVPKTCVVISG